MPGFCLSNISEPVITERCHVAHVEEDAKVGTVFCTRSTLDKFMNDKAFCWSGDYFVIAEGVLLNKAELIARGAPSRMADLVVWAYHHYGNEFFSMFRGSFSGALYISSEDEWIVYTSHYGDSPVFYYDGDCGFCFGSQANYIVDILRNVGIRMMIDEHAIYAALSYAFMVDDRTYAQEIKRLLPGHYAVISGSGLAVKRYYRPCERIRDVSDVPERDLVNRIDELFRAAVAREFNKDKEYGYRHLCDLSGGLDSRMTTWVARDMGYESMLNITYCQSGYVDEVVAERIAAYLGNELLFKPLDDHSFVFEADRLVGMNNGLALYSAITGGESLLRSINTSKFGLEHTGQLGDVVLGTFVHDLTKANTVEHCGYYSDTLLDRVPLPNKEDWTNREQYLFCTRAFLGALGSHLIRRNYTEVASPFLDVDFLDYCLSIPVGLRVNHNLYRKWILEKYPEAGLFIWEKVGCALNAHRPKIFLARVSKKIRTVLSSLSAVRHLAPVMSMNPFDLWWEQDGRMRDYVESAGLKIAEADVSDKLKNDMRELLNEGTTMEKTQVVNVLYALRVFGFSAEGLNSDGLV